MLEGRTDAYRGWGGALSEAEGKRRKPARSGQRTSAAPGAGRIQTAETQGREGRKDKALLVLHCDGVHWSPGKGAAAVNLDVVGREVIQVRVWVTGFPKGVEFGADGKGLGKR